MPDLKFITPSFAVTSELAADDFAPLAVRGFKSVISNRGDGEDVHQLTGLQEAVFAQRTGLAFRHVPVAKSELFTDSAVGAMADAIASLPTPIVAHCKSGVRSAILWAAAQARTQPVDDVLAALAAAGFDLEFLRDDLDAQADRSTWSAPQHSGGVSPAKAAAA